MEELVPYGMDDPEIGDEYKMYKVSDVDAYVEKLKARIQELENEKRGRAEKGMD